MAKGKNATRTRIGVSERAGGVTLRKQAEEALLKAGALQSAIFNSANFSSIATDAKGVIQIFNVGAGRMLGLYGTPRTQRCRGGGTMRAICRVSGQTNVAMSPLCLY